MFLQKSTSLSFPESIALQSQLISDGKNPNAISCSTLQSTFTCNVANTIYNTGTTNSATNTQTDFNSKCCLTVTLPTGGTQFDYGIYRVAVFTSNGTFSMGSKNDFDVFIVAGGGAGGCNQQSAGGGGAGGARKIKIGGGSGGFAVYDNTIPSIVNGGATINIGTGGIGNNVNVTAPNGNNSSIIFNGTTISVTGGGGAGGYNGTTYGGGANGGNGGGSGYSLYLAGNGISQEGNNGGGANANNQGGAGGIGIDVSNIFGNSIPNNGKIAGGGNAGGNITSQNYGGGIGGVLTINTGNNIGGNAISNTGGGGGGGGYFYDGTWHATKGGNGADGIVLIRWLK